MFLFLIDLVGGRLRRETQAYTRHFIDNAAIQRLPAAAPRLYPA